MLPRKNTTSRINLSQPRAVFFGALGAAALVGVLAIVFFARFVFSPSKTPANTALQSAVAEKLASQFGRLYSVASLQPGQPLYTPIAVATPQAPPPQNDSPISPISPVAPLPAPDGRLHYDALLTARLSESLYQSVDAADFISRTLKLDTSAERKIEQIIVGPGGDRIRELAGIEANADSLASMRLVRETAHAGARFEFRAIIAAERTGDGWRISVASLEPKSPLPAGETLGKFNGRLLDITRESDLATLRRMIAHGDETLRRVEQARERYHAELAANITRAINTNLDYLPPGALFNGKAILPGRADTPGVSVEIISVDRAHSTVNALLRADGSWREARPLEGRCDYDTATGVFSLALNAREGAPLSGANGASISDGKALRLRLQFSGAELAGDTSAWSCKLARVPEADRASVIAAFNIIEQNLLDATRPGLAYRVRTGPLTGNITTPSSGDTSVGKADFVLRFISQNTTDGTLVATLESPFHDLKYDLHGSIIFNAQRANGFPLRLMSTVDSKTSARAPLGLSLRLDDARAFAGTMRTRETLPATVTLLDAQALARLAAELKAATLPAPTRPAESAPAPSAENLPPDNGAYIWADGGWKILPANNARIARSALQKIGGVWISAVSLIKTRPDKQDTGTLTFDGAITPPSAQGGDVTLAFRGTFKLYAGIPAGKTPIEVAALESKSKGKKRVIEIDRLGDAAATFGRLCEPIEIEPAKDFGYLVRVRRALPPGRYTLSAPDHYFEFEVK